MAGIKGKSGPPGNRNAAGNPGGSPAPGNSNAVRHGGHGYLALGKLPRGASYIKRLVNEFRRSLTREVTDVHGKISVYHASLIQTACRHEVRALLLSRWLKQFTEPADGGGPAPDASKEAKAQETITAADRLRFLAEIATAGEARDRILEKLGLASDAATKGDPADVFAAAIAARATGPAKTAAESPPAVPTPLRNAEKPTRDASDQPAPAPDGIGAEELAQIANERGGL